MGARASSFLPSDLTDLFLWLRADEITGVSDGDNLATWLDESGQANDFAESNDARRPSYHTAVQNGLAAVRFVRGNSERLTNGSSLDFTAAATVFIAKQSDTTTVAYGLLGASPNGDLGFLEAVGGDGGIAMVEIGIASIANEGGIGNRTVNWEIAGYTWDGSLGVNSEAEVYRNRTSVGTGIYNAGALNIAATRILGSASFSFEFFDGDIGEVVAYDRLLPAAERTQVWDYLIPRWV